MTAYTPVKLAKLFGVTERTVNEWIADGLPVLKAGKRGAGNASRISLPAAVKWYVQKKTSRSEAELQRARKDRELGDRLAMENATRRGELIEWREAARIYAGQVTRAKARLLQCPNVIGQHSPIDYRAAIVAAADRGIRDALEELASGDTAGVPTAAEANH